MTEALYKQKDCIAETESGKTLAFGVCVLHRIYSVYEPLAKEYWKSQYLNEYRQQHECMIICF